jgi:hypothetical protein
MTEQEAQVLSNRIPRIWASYVPKLVTRDTGNLPFEFVFTLRDNWKLTYICTSHTPFPLVMVTKESFEMVCLSDGTIHYDMEHKHGMEKMPMDNPLDLWLPLLRRGCWLSGLPIEASAHEKVEWMQGFSPEELEAWNLN